MKRSFMFLVMPVSYCVSIEYLSLGWNDSDRCESCLGDKKQELWHMVVISILNELYAALHEFHCP